MQYAIIHTQHGAYLEPMDDNEPDYMGLPFNEARNQLASLFRSWAEELETMDEEEYLQWRI